MFFDRGIHKKSQLFVPIGSTQEQHK